VFFESAKRYAFETQDLAVHVVSETRISEPPDNRYADGNTGTEIRGTKFDFDTGSIRVRGEAPLRSTPYWALRELELSGDRRMYLCEAYAAQRGTCYPVLWLRQQPSIGA
jgi:hypothetical protein